MDQEQLFSYIRKEQFPIYLSKNIADACNSFTRYTILQSFLKKLFNSITIGGWHDDVTLVKPHPFEVSLHLWYH